MFGLKTLVNILRHTEDLSYPSLSYYFMIYNAYEWDGILIFSWDIYIIQV